MAGTLRTPPKALNPKTLAQFQQTYDRNVIVPRKIDDALKRLGDGWETEMEFMKAAGVSNVELAAFRDNYADYIVVVASATGSPNRKRIWFGSKTAASVARKMVS